MVILANRAMVLENSPTQTTLSQWPSDLFLLSLQNEIHGTERVSFRETFSIDPQIEDYEGKKQEEIDQLELLY